DLDLRFTPSPTALEGIAGHRLAAARRGEEYEREVVLELGYGNLLVRGRADGYDPAANRLDEVKTFRGDLSRQPENHRALHRAQAKVYGSRLRQARALTELHLALVYVDVATHAEALVESTWSAETLKRFFDDLCARFAAWADEQAAHRRERDRALSDLRFPHP